MLIYNSQKEFLGIDEQDLATFGFKSFTELRAQAADFADLFVKTPGYIHNFKHVHWIDFITCADSTESPKVIVYANEISFKCNISITTAYLVDTPSQKAYLVTLQNIKELNKDENSEIAQDIITKPVPVAVTEAVSLVTQTIEEEYQQPPAKLKIEEPIEDPYESFTIEDELEEPLLDEPEINLSQDFLQEEHIKSSFDAPLEIDLGDDFKLETQEETEKIEEKTEVQTPVVEDDLTENEEFDNSYVFDPKIASDELGLPVDLIEEFIEDFIGQAKDFKVNLYESLQDGDLDNIKILSHKLKGVAANLRVEDAFEVLAIINTSEDLSIIKKNLNHFYIIIAKLSGEEIKIPEAKEEDDDDLLLAFKDDIQEEVVKADTLNNFKEDLELNVDDILNVEDSVVPQKIEIPELADDDFMDNTSIDAIEIDEESLAVDIETVDMQELSEEVSQIDELPDLLEINEDITQEESTLEEPHLEEKTINYDKIKAANEIGLDRDTFNEFLEDYVADSHGLCNSIKDAISSNDSIKWQREAVQLKGMSDNMRINSFTSELWTLLNTADSTIAAKAVDSIISIVTSISQMEK